VTSKQYNYTVLQANLAELLVLQEGNRQIAKPFRWWMSYNQPNRTNTDLLKKTCSASSSQKQRKI